MHQSFLRRTAASQRPFQPPPHVHVHLARRISSIPKTPHRVTPGRTDSGPKRSPAPRRALARGCAVLVGIARRSVLPDTVRERDALTLRQVTGVMCWSCSGRRRGRYTWTTGCCGIVRRRNRRRASSSAFALGAPALRWRKHWVAGRAWSAFCDLLVNGGAVSAGRKGEGTKHGSSGYWQYPG